MTDLSDAEVQARQLAQQARHKKLERQLTAMTTVLKMPNFEAVELTEEQHQHNKLPLRTGEGLVMTCSSLEGAQEGFPKTLTLTQWRPGEGTVTCEYRLIRRVASAVSGPKFAEGEDG